MGNEMTDVERVARIEERLDAIERVILRMEAKLDAWQETYVPRTEINEMFRARDEQIRELKEEQRNSKQVWPQWVAAIAAIMSVIVAIWAMTR
jgi:predicted RNase H-like nuclease (RuvC/YqgF family)